MMQQAGRPAPVFFMEHRTVGLSGISVSRCGLGCVTFGREIDESTSYRILDHAVANGINLLDTADSYGGGNAQIYRLKMLGISDVRETSGEMHSSENIIGRWLRARRCREKVIIQTKTSGDYTRPQISASIDASLKRLQTDRIDLFLLHYYRGTPPLAETLEALDRAIRSGKVRAVGCSNYSADQVRHALRISEENALNRFEIVQPAYSLISREIERHLIPLCRERQVSVITYSPLAAGFLTGKYQPDLQKIPKGSRFDIKPGHADIYFKPDNFRLLERLRALSTAVGVPMARLAAGWVFKNRNLTSVLIGATSTSHIDNGLEAVCMDFPPEWDHTLLN